LKGRPCASRQRSIVIERSSYYAKPSRGALSAKRNASCTGALEEAHKAKARALLAIQKASKMSDKYPPRSETELQLEARVIALEYLLKHCFWKLIVQQINADDGDDGDAVNEAKLFQKLCRESLKKAAFAGVDPALSDHVTAQGGFPSRGNF
jgi:hypothetical protein